MNKVESNTLKKNFNDWAIFSIINNTKLSDKSVLGWKIVAGKKVTVEVIFHIIRKFRNEIVVRAVGSQGKVSLGDLAAGAQKLNFYLPDDMVLFQTDVKHVEQNGDVRIKIPEMIAQIDRRKFLRLFVEDGIDVNVKFLKENHGHKVSTQQFIKSCFDVSAGGFSFIISKSESRFFMKDDSMFGIELQIGKENITVNADIINILEVEPTVENKLHYKGWKVCVKYSHIKKESKNLLNDFIFRYVDISEAI
jgi:hypothetical protein